MKKFLMSTFFLTLFAQAFTQYHNVAYVSELHKYNSVTKEWELYKKNSDTNIPIILEDDFITVVAQTPTMYKIYKSTMESIEKKSISGVRFVAKDLRNDKSCVIDLLDHDQTGLLVLSIILDDASTNLRFFMKKDQ